MNTDRIFSTIRFEVCDRLDPKAPLVVAMDDSIVTKTGLNIFGVGWRRDPKSPAFQANLIRGLRVLQLSAGLPDPQHQGIVRTVPIDFQHVPTPKKPRRNATPQQLDEYKRESKQSRMAWQGALALQKLRHQMDADPAQASRHLIAVVDGRYTNRTVFKEIPSNTTLIGRIRKDTKLYFQPEESGPKMGRPRKYGAPAPRPQELLRDLRYSFVKVPVWAAGVRRKCAVKILRNVMVRYLGVDKTATVLAIKPWRYRESPNSHLKYRKPAYLICTDPTMKAKDILQAYVWRWEIEVNFRDEKQQIGLGKAQVRVEESVARVMQFTAAIYGLLLLAGHQACQGHYPRLEPAKWLAKKYPKKRYSTRDLQRDLRHELWGQYFNSGTFRNLSRKPPPSRSAKKSLPSLLDGAFYAA